MSTGDEPSSLVLSLDAPGVTRAAAGGKAAALARARRAGLAVPRGAVVLRGAFDTWRAARGDGAAERVLLRRVAAALAGVIGDGDGEWAVRSSATTEDGPGLSFAGQHDSFLGVRRADVARRVRDCWASLDNKHAVAYRETHGVAHELAAMAVVVQGMVARVRCAGVLFTANVVSGHRAQMQIEAVAGLGERLVAGAATPHSITLDADGAVLEARVPPDGVAVLRADDIAALRAMAARVVEAFDGVPQDIEWCIDDAGVVHVVQSRSITTLFPLPDGFDANAGDARAWFGMAASQGTLDPFSEFGFDTYVTTMTAGMSILLGTEISRDYFVRAGGRLFGDATWFVRSPLIAAIALGGLMELDDIDPVLGPASKQLVQEPAFRPTAWSWSQVTMLFAVARTVCVMVWYILPGTIAAFWRPAGRAEECFRKLAEDRRTLSAALERLPTLRDLLDGPTLGDLLGPSCSEASLPDTPPIAAGLYALTLCRSLAPAEQKYTHLLLTRSLPFNPTTMMGDSVWAVAKAAIDADDDGRFAVWLADADVAAIEERLVRQRRAPRGVLDALDALLLEFGYRAIGEIDCRRPRFRDAPAVLLQSARSLVKLGLAARTDPAAALRLPDALSARGERDAQAWLERSTEILRRDCWFGGVRAAMLEACARRVRLLAGLREFAKFRMVTQFGIAREWVAARATAELGVDLDDPAADVFYLRHGEIVAGNNNDAWRSLVAARRETEATEMHRKLLPNVLVSDGRTFYPWSFSGGPGGETRNDDDEEHCLRGVGVSVGTVTATAVVVTDPAAAVIEPGSIIVTRATDPSWTPLLLSAGGLVLEVGGALTHGSVAARELGIPAVVAVDHATRSIRTGDRISVDGSVGVVRLQPSEEE